MALKMAVGEKYGYKEHPYTLGDPVHQVEVLKLGPPRVRPRQVRVRYLNGEYEGMDEWVSQARLIVPWEEARALIEDERRIIAVRQASDDVYETLEWRVVDQVLSSLPLPWCNQASLGWRSTERELLIIQDLEKTAPVLGLRPVDLLAEPCSFIDRFGIYKAPFQVALRVAQYCCQRFSQEVLADVRGEEEALRKALITGRYVCPSNGDIEYDLPRAKAEEDLRQQEPVFALVREWCGEQAVSEFDRVAALKAELGRLRGLLESTAQWLGDAGHPRKAEALRKELKGSEHG